MRLLFLVLPFLALSIEQPKLNQAVVVNLSRYWLNYRHSSSAMLVYNTLKRLGYSDDQLLFFMADDHACHPRNIYPGELRQDTNMPNVYTDVIIDYKGRDVSIDKFMRGMLGRDRVGTPDALRVMKGQRMFVYLIGHGGEGFMKFQNRDEITSWDIAYLFKEMEIMNRYKEMLFVVDTCQASSLSDRITAKNVITVGSSITGLSSYSGRISSEIGAITSDLWDENQDILFTERLDKDSNMTVRDYLKYFTYPMLKTQHGWREDLFNRPMEDVKMIDFLGYVPKKVTIDLKSIPWDSNIF
ncbi:gpi-anchor transamidase, putative [Entamoeba invadens IP1]|uniref:Gpi-anchor transamidase, putative n=1 Tax=Entamoeba invadens IP1 TaxID=370355 RepID=A0A0A1TW66_ENTIV|nr:gpi-anchor transamidase, putative [Entamoeba invadens IP1]ELP84726.1 gpi-anchor transamidase, putative [Entamoeba invadens IP1]|eukprot:XP_004184072.1 gpi-anchor transamidase, putative [Entamoeba invadens IP1]